MVLFLFVILVGDLPTQHFRELLATVGTYQ
jgi:hypothetical protein